MDINDLTAGQAKELAKMLDAKDTKTPFEIGKSYLFRTVTHIELGRVVEMVGKFAVLEEASWIADTGRYHDCLRDGTPEEIEPYPNGTIVNTDSLINAAPWEHDLPREQK